MGPYLVMHGFVLRFEGEYVLRALGPWLAIVGIDVSHDVSDTILKILNGVAVGVEVTGAIPFTIKVFVGS